ncbi:MAG: GNAT family N-acetyltransferase [Promethearchaeati archaeon SRVP18_Atabeyarchaeia-1]
MRVIPSNLHSCHGIIQDFRKKVPSSLTAPFADIVFPDEKLPSIIGREARFLLAVEERGAIGCCVLALSTEPLRTEILLIHTTRNDDAAIQLLVDYVLALLNSRRAPDLEAKYVEGMHSGSLKTVLRGRGFAETVRDRMLLEVPKHKGVSKAPDETFRVTATDSLLNWRALYLAATTSRPFEECRRQVHSETPYGTIQEDDLARLLVHYAGSAVGTIGYSICRNVGYLDRLSVLPDLRDRSAIAGALVSEAVRIVSKKKCDYVVIDADRSFSRERLAGIGFKFLGKISYFSKVITRFPAGRATGSDEN